MNPPRDGAIPAPTFKEIQPSSSGGMDLIEVQKTVQHYGVHLFGIPQEIKRISA